jgi:predicted PurR-regulated permease PerM
MTPLSAPHAPKQQDTLDRFHLNRWLQVFLTIIAGAAVAVIAWSVIQRFLHIIILLIASFLVAYILDPLVARLQRGGIPRALAILLMYLGLFGVIAAVVVLLLGPLTTQLHGALNQLPSIVDEKSGRPTKLDLFFRSHGINLTVQSLRNQLGSSISSAGTALLANTLSIIQGVVQVVTDLLLVLAITFYLLLDGHAMHNRAVRLLPGRFRDRWFFFEAALNKVLGGYIRGQLLVALTVGIAAGAGCALLGVHYFLVIGLLAFLFELIPMIGPVLGMIPAVIIALFQSVSLTIWVVVFFIVLQQIESNVIVPRVSGHAVGLHPLAALLALLVGLELGGIGGALLSVPLAGVLWVMLIALYGDVTGQTQVLTPRLRGTSAVTLARQMIGSRQVMGWRRASSGGVVAAAPPPSAESERLATIRHEQEHLIEQFEAQEAEQAAVEAGAAAMGVRESGPDDPQAGPVPG